LIYIPRVVVAGLRGGSGKTTLSLGLLRALRTKGLSVIPFKKGPDYIDAGWLSVASGRPCYNLDPFLIGEKNVLPSFLTHGAGSDIAIIEGNRGIFDGMDVKGSQSTARLARMLKAPVILIIDITKMTRTAAALVLGVKKFEPGLILGGVVLNQVAGKRHEGIVHSAIERYAGVPVLGAIPRFKKKLSERHMGLVPFQEHPEMEEAINEARKLITASVDLDRVIKIARKASKLQYPIPRVKKQVPVKVKIGVLKDSAFQFYYPENLEALKAAGAELIEVSPLLKKTAEVPDIDALYIGGGFPETHALALSKNKSFLKSLKDKVEEGLPVYAECGGLMYLGEHLFLNERKFEMAGVFPYSFPLEERPVAHGYSIAQVTSDKNPFYKKGTILKGHEFHYSRPVKEGPVKEAPAGVGEKKALLTLKMERGTGIEGGKDGLTYKNCFATYTHTHALGTPDWAKGIIGAAERYRIGRG
jgi:cobyrinic acid a,c-diamide synthase